MQDKTELSDGVLVQEVLSGDVETYGVLMSRYEQKLIRYVTYLIHNNTLANDVVQDTFIKAYQHIKGFNPKYKFSSWIYRIAHNEAMNAVKKYKHHADTDIEDISDLGYEPHLDDKLDQELLKDRVHLCISRLDLKYREVVQLVYLEHMKYEEVSDILHVPTSTVGVWLSRAKKSLRVICSKLGVER